MEEEEKERKQRGILTESLGLRAEDVISLVGGGGKTTLMFRLAHELLVHGKNVVTTTTTRILKPTSEETPFFFVHRNGEKIRDFLESHLEEYHHVTVAAEILEDDKVKGVSPDVVVDLWKLSVCDYMIIEADGAAGKPVKAPREQEPVIPLNTTLVVAILGVDGLGLELDEKNVFQPERISQLTGVALGERLGVEAMATLITHPEGIFKGTPVSSRVVAFLNKVDLPGGMARARDLAAEILNREHPQIERIVLGQLKRNPPVAEVVFSQGRRISSDMEEL